MSPRQTITVGIVAVGIVLVAALKMQSSDRQRGASGEGSRATTEHPNKTRLAPVTHDAPRNEAKRESLSLADNYLNPEFLAKAKLRIEKINREETDLSNRKIELSNIIKQLCTTGFFTEACDLIELDYGRVRESQIQRLMGAANVPAADRVRFLNTLTDKRDKKAACSGMMDSFTTNELLHLDIKKLGLIDPEVASMARLQVSNELIQDMEYLRDVKPQGHEALLAEVVNHSIEGLASNEVTPKQLKEILDLDQNQDSFDQWAKLSKLPKSAKASLDALEENMFHKMISSDANRAMSEVLSYSNKFQDDAAGGRALSIWYRLDSRGANAWLLKNLNLITPNQRNNIAAAVAQTSQADGDVENAKRWMDTITDGPLKEKLSKKIK